MLTLPDVLIQAIQRYRAERHIKTRVIAEGVLNLYRMFTGQAPLRPGYLAKPSLRAAYVLYYLPVQYLKVCAVLDELERMAGPIHGPVLDFGAGPGTASLAFGARLSQPVAVDLLDVVDEALEDARTLLAQATPHLRPRVVDEPARRYALILATHVLSEIRDPDVLTRLAKEWLEPLGYLVVIEPAMKEATRRLMAWRDHLVAAGFQIAAPCLGPVRCPMLGHEEMWCHQDLPWARPAFIDELDRRTGLNKESLKFSYLVVTRLGRTLGTTSPAQWRVVSDRHSVKGRFWMSLCGKEGALCGAEMLTRHRDAARRDFERARRGDLLVVDPPIAGDRVRLGVEHTVVRPHK